mmetsp:Transcript_57209/g.125236  ORF Transcript_57209/g.125236 Transcript_57209/m.125236 type:complete len:87 (+) Transcript_57209:732-992(+)
MWSACGQAAPVLGGRAWGADELASHCLVIEEDDILVRAAKESETGAAAVPVSATADVEEAAGRAGVEAFAGRAATLKLLTTAVPWG